MTDNDKIKLTILEYLSDENLQPNKIPDEKLDFGFTPWSSVIDN